MDSLEAMDHIDRMFLTIKDSIWLPQWSFDFWTIPYLIGKGFSFELFKKLMWSAHQMLTLEIDYVPHREKSVMQQEYLEQMVRAIESAQQSTGQVLDDHLLRPNEGATVEPCPNYFF